LLFQLGFNYVGNWIGSWDYEPSVTRQTGNFFNGLLSKQKRVRDSFQFLFLITDFQEVYAQTKASPLTKIASDPLKLIYSESLEVKLPNTKIEKAL
jgi:hypothetical protein